MQIRIKHIQWCYQSGMSIRSIIFSLLVSRNTIKRDIRIYEDLGIDLERLLKIDAKNGRYPPTKTAIPVHSIVNFGRCWQI